MLLAFQRACLLLRGFGNKQANLLCFSQWGDYSGVRFVQALALASARGGVVQRFVWPWRASDSGNLFRWRVEGGWAHAVFAASGPAVSIDAAFFDPQSQIALAALTYGAESFAPLSLHLAVEDDLYGHQRGFGVAQPSRGSQVQVSG